MSLKFDHPMSNDLESIQNILKENDIYITYISTGINSFTIYIKMKSGNMIIINKIKDELFLTNKNISGHSISEFLDELNK
jgi:hypothetical protein